MKKIISLVLIMIFAVTLAGCSNDQMDYQTNTVGKEARLTEQNQQRLLDRQPPLQLDFSNERDNLNKRSKELSDPNKIGYVYLVSYGKVMAFYTIKGKVSSMQSRVTTNQQAVQPFGGSTVVLMESPDFDGTYGQSEQGIFFYTTDGVLVQWSGEYMYSAQPLKLTTQPELIRTIQ
jgi:hypothetical protein